MANHFGINIRNRYELNEHPEQVLRKFIRRLNDSSQPFNLKTANNKVFFKTRAEEAKWWSPELSISIEQSENGTLIREVMGPNPETFTFTIFGIIGGSVLCFFAVMLALSQLNLGLSPTLSLVVAALALLFILIIYSTIALGRRRAASQMKAMTDYAKEIMSC